MKRKNLLNNYLGLLFVLIASFFAFRAFFVPGFFPIHDDTQVARVFEMGKSLESGMLPVRWVDDLGFGYGYPIFSFYAPLAYYVGGFITLFGINALVATKIMMALGVILSGITMYFLGEKLWGKLGGIFSALFYVYATYHAVDVFVRGDVAEFWAYAFIPLVFLGMWGIYKNKSIVYPALGAIGLAGTILSHNLTAFMTIPFAGLIALLLGVYFLRKKQFISLAQLVVIFSFGVLLSAFYWLPVFPEMKYTNVLSQIGGSANFADHFVCLPQLWFSPWGYGGSAPGCADGLSFMLGRIYVLIMLLAGAGIVLFWKKSPEKRLLMILSFVLLFASLFLTLPYSKLFWEKIPFFAFLQYPWRFLLIAAFFNALLAGGVVSLYKERVVLFIGKFYGLLLYALVLGILLFTQIKFFQPQRFNGNQEDHYVAYPGIQFEASSLSHEYLPKGFTIPKTLALLPKSLFVLPEQVQVKNMVITTARKEATLVLMQPAQVHINVAYFPAWHAYIDNKEVALSQTTQGMLVNMPAGTHRLSLVYASTFIESFANLISLTSAGVFILAIIYFIRYKKYGKSS